MNDWTLMVYISADDVLVNFAVESLKQLKRAAGDGVLVVAQLDPNFDKKSVQRYAFSDSEKAEPSIENNLLRSRLGQIDMASPTALTDFINFVTDAKEYHADHYGLVLWGHGPELLLDDDIRGEYKRNYFTPANLKQALDSTTLKKKQGQFDIIVIDACCMALMEVATAIQGGAKYLIASQDAVPDTSFPYEQILLTLRGWSENGDVQGISKKIPKAYKQDFQDYISTPANGLRGITLSAVNLDAIATLATPLTSLASSLLQASTEASMRGKILKARKNSHAFEFGLFVDLFDFCEQLESTGHGNGQLTAACRSMRAAIAKCVIENQTVGSNRAHGLSIYFPYETTNPIEIQQKVILAKNGTNHPTKDRIQRIIELEKDYSVLKTLAQPAWMQFIRDGWSPMLAREYPNQLDTHYSAQQCAQNLLHAEG